MSGATVQTNASINTSAVNARKTKNSAKAAESAAEMARSPVETTNIKSPIDLNAAFNIEGSSYRKDMAGMQEIIKSNNFLREAFAENISIDEKFSIVISELYKLKKLNEATEQKYAALLQRFETHEDTIRQNGSTQEDTFQEITGRLTGVENNIVDLHAEAQGIATQINDLSQKYEKTNQDIGLLKGFSDKFEKQFTQLASKSAALAARSMDKNLMITGIPELKKENCKESVRLFLRDKMNIKVDTSEIKFAYRQGKFTQGKTRVMITKVSRDLKEFILSKKGRLRQLQQDTGEAYYVNIQLPEAIVAERKALQYELQRIKKFNKTQQQDEDKLQYHVKSNQLYVENQLQEQEVFPPRPTELFTSPKEQEVLDDMLMGMSQPKTKGGSVFVGFAIPVQTLQDVNRAYRKVRQMYPSYDHVMMAYKIKDFSGYQDDGEHSAGIKLHALILERKKSRLAIFVARNFGGINLGPIRFSYILQVANQAIDRLLEIADFVPAPTPVISVAEQRGEVTEAPSQSFPSSPPPREEWPSVDSQEWDPLKAQKHPDENINTPDEELHTADEEIDTESVVSSDDENNTTVKSS